MMLLVGKGIGELGGGNTFADSMKLMQTDYTAYCRGKFGSIHKNATVNLGALFEWLLLGSCTILAFVKLYSELTDWLPAGWHEGRDPRLVDQVSIRSMSELSSAHMRVQP